LFPSQALLPIFVLAVVMFLILMFCTSVRPTQFLNALDVLTGAFPLLYHGYIILSFVMLVKF